MRNNYFLPPKKLLKELGSLPCFRMPPKVRGKMEFSAVKRQSGLQCKIRYSQHTQKHRATDPVLQGLKQADGLLQIQGQLGLQHGSEASLGCLRKILSQKKKKIKTNRKILSRVQWHSFGIPTSWVWSWKSKISCSYLINLVSKNKMILEKWVGDIAQWLSI